MAVVGTSKTTVYLERETAKAFDFLRRTPIEQSDLPNSYLDLLDMEYKEATPGAKLYEFPVKALQASAADYYTGFEPSSGSVVEDSTMAIESQFRVRESFLISRADAKQNAKSPNKLFDLIVEHSKRARKRLKNKVAADLVAATQPTNGPVTLPLICPTDGGIDTSPTLHNIDGDDNSWWGCNVETGGGSALTSSYDDLDKVIQECRLYGETEPSHLLMSQNSLLALKKGARALGTMEMAGGSATRADMGFKVKSYEDIPIVIDRHLSTGTAATNAIYVLNKRSLKLFAEKGEMWVLEGPIDMRPNDQDAWKWSVYFAGAHITLERRALGLLHNFTES